MRGGTDLRWCAGRKTRYTYVAAAGSHKGGSPLTGIAKLDMLAATPEAAVAAHIDLGDTCDVGEPQFVPRSASPEALQGVGGWACCAEGECRRRNDMP